MRKTTSQNYFSIWRSFNKFLVRLDTRPSSWEEHTAMFCMHLIDNGSQSSTLRSYVSATKAVLRVDGYEWNHNRVLLESLVKACRV